MKNVFMYNGPPFSYVMLIGNWQDTILTLSIHGGWQWLHIDMILLPQAAKEGSVTPVTPAACRNRHWESIDGPLRSTGWANFCDSYANRLSCAFIASICPE